MRLRVGLSRRGPPPHFRLSRPSRKPSPPRPPPRSTKARSGRGGEGRSGRFLYPDLTLCRVFSSQFRFYHRGTLSGLICCRIISLTLSLLVRVACLCVGWFVASFIYRVCVTRMLYILWPFAYGRRPICTRLGISFRCCVCVGVGVVVCVWVARPHKNLPDPLPSLILAGFVSRWSPWRDSFSAGFEPQGSSLKVGLRPGICMYIYIYYVLLKECSFFGHPRGGFARLARCLARLPRLAATLECVARVAGACAELLRDTVR